MAAIWGTPSMVAEIADYYDNQEKVSALIFTTVNKGDGNWWFFVGISEDADVIQRAIRQNSGVLFSASGETPSADDG